MGIITDRGEMEKLVREEIGKLIEKDSSEIEGDLNLAEEMGVDSLYMLELYAMIEETFGVMIPVKNIQSMSTINKILDNIVEFQKN